MYSDDPISLEVLSFLCSWLANLIIMSQTILPIIHSFGKGLCADGIDALARIGSSFLSVLYEIHLSPLLFV